MTNNNQGMYDKSHFSGFTYCGTALVETYKNIVDDAQRIIVGDVDDEIKDVVELSLLCLPNTSQTTVLTLNHQEYNHIVQKHGYFSIEDMIVTANEFDEGVYVNSNMSATEKINLVKYTDDGYFLLAANRYNGFSVVTFFEKHPDNRRAKKYLQNIMSKGISF